MFEAFYPSARCHSAYDIPYEDFYKKGYRGIIFDIDNTLVKHGAPATPEVVDFFKMLHDMGFKTCLISNNKAPRVAPFAEAVESDFMPKANKPSGKGYIAAIQMMGLTKDETIFVGDQIFTDIWGANRAGIASVLTDPIDPHEEIQIVLKRILEKPILFLYMRRSTAHIL